jgi:UDP-N-acetylmuramoyl-tripeptide--D-alanyl-D-alanine ligase
MQLTLGEIAEMLGTRSEEPYRVARGYSIDSRTLAAGEVFFALRGPRFDGHDFVPAALERGAVAAVVSWPFRAQAPAELARRLIAVNDPLGALQELSRAVRRRWAGPVIAVTGSTGKTTTKELIAAAMSAQFNVHKSVGNLNNAYGVPLTLLALEPQHRVAVLELGMSAAGEIAALARIAEPQTGVVTNVAPVHLEFFDSIEGIAAAKRELIENLKPPATAILNRDDPRVCSFATGFAGRVITYGFAEGADVRASGWQPWVGEERQIGSRFLVEASGSRSEVFLPLAGRHNAENALAAIAAAHSFGVPLASASRALREFRTLHQRAEILTLPEDIVVIDDSYNSNPRAFEQMLATLAVWPGASRRIVVAGEMLELGPSSPDWHRQAGRQCAQAGIDWLVAVQGDAQYIVEGAIGGGLPSSRTRFFDSAHEAGEFASQVVRPGDVVLVKGSRGVRLEAVVERLKELHGKSDVPASAPLPDKPQQPLPLEKGLS